MDTDRPIPRAPRGLDLAGRGLWRELTSVYDFDPDEAVLAEAACKTADELVRMETFVAKAPPLIKGSMGQLRAHPLFTELRQHRSSLARLLAQIRTEDAAGEHGSYRSTAGRQMAHIRWSRRSG